MDTKYFTQGWDARFNGLYQTHNPYQYGTSNMLNGETVMMRR